MTSADRELSALARAIPLLRCPNCERGLEATDSGVVCASGHSFDRARQGHLTLLSGRGRRFPGDTSDQILARERVLGSGLFDPVADAVASCAAQDLHADSPRPEVGSRAQGTPVRAQGSPVRTQGGPVVLDVGAGTGFYLARTLDAFAGEGPLGIGTDLSAPAARRLARAHRHAAALVADTWAGLPLADGVADVLQVVFAPRNPEEFARLVRPGGLLVVVVPGAGHLEPLRSTAGMLTVAADKTRRLAGGPGTGFDAGRVRDVDTTVTVPAAAARDLALMGPSGVHLDADDLAERLGPGRQTVRIHVGVWRFRRLSR